MRSIWMLPFTFVAGVHGFALFAPYLLLIATIGLVLKRRRAAAPAIVIARPVIAEVFTTGLPIACAA